MRWRTKFRVQQPGGSPRVFTFEQDEIVLGRHQSTADLVVADSAVARRHCAFVIHDDGQVTIHDRQSPGGTYVNGDRVRESVFTVADKLVLPSAVVTLVAPPQRVESAAVLAEVELVRHAKSAGTAVHQVHVTVVEANPGVSLRYRLSGELERLRIAPNGMDPQRLWEHTCLELFAASPGAATYSEWNFAPRGQSTRFDFSAYRERSNFETGVARVRMKAGAADIVVTASNVAVAPDAELGIAAITKDLDGQQSYWALAHPSTKPDFHDRGTMILKIGSSGAPPMA